LEENRVNTPRDAMPDVTTEHEGSNASVARVPGSLAGKPPSSRPSHQRQWLIGVVGGLVLILACVFGIPRIELALNTVSTDDAYVNGHATFVAPRVSGQIFRVLVDDNSRVRKGDLLAQIDKEPFEIAVARKKAAVDTANADLDAAIAGVRATEAEARRAGAGNCRARRRTSKTRSRFCTIGSPRS
jgi:multidrug resistance efflux pump